MFRSCHALLLALVAFFALVPFTYAQRFEKTPGQSFAMVLDAQAGNKSTWVDDDLNGATALQATVQIQELRYHDHWLPVFTIWLDQVEGGAVVHRYGVQMISFDRKSPLKMAVVEGDGFTKEKPIYIAKEPLDLYATIKIQCSWEKDGTLSVQLGEKDTFRTPMTGHVNRVTVTSSTGTLDIEPLILGTMK